MASTPITSHTEAPSEAAAYEHNGRPVSRAAFYAIACDPRRSVAVEACAGAGKTWMLVSRILRALLEGVDAANPDDPLRLQPHEILAITFTKKAAGEMRQRLHEWLQAFSQQTPAELSKELLARGMTPAAAQNASGVLQGLHRRLLGEGRPVQIRTFHGWFAALLRTAPLAVLRQLGLPPNYQLLEDDAEAVAEVWRPFLQAVAGQPELRADYQALALLHGRFQTQKALVAALSKRVEFALADATGVVDASVLRFDQQFPEMAGLAQPQDWLRERPKAALWAAAKALGRASAPTFAAKGVALELALTQGHWQGVVDALLTQKGEPRKFGEKIVGIEAVRQAQDQVLAVEQACRQHAAWLYQGRMARLTRCLLDEFAALKRTRGWVDMNDVERAAQVLLSDPVLSGWVQQRLDARVKHLLIDEFQDTNPLQWQALHAWLSGYAGAGGGGAVPSVFIVGDPKQSIYRFRRAEPQVFKAAQAFVAQGLGGDLLSCDHTRRNAPAVIAAVNNVMLAAQTAGEYPDYRRHTTEQADAEHEEGGAGGSLLRLPAIARPATGSASGSDVMSWRDSLTTPRELSEETLRSLECRQAARWVAAQLGAGLAPDELMVLARKRDRLSVMQDELRALGIATEQPEKLDLAEAPEVQDVIALVDALVSPTHNLSLARALKSPLFGVDDAGLTRLAQAVQATPSNRHEGPGSDAKQPAVSWLALLQSQQVQAADGSDSSALALQALGSTLSQYQDWLAHLPPHDALQAIYQHGDLLARFAAAVPAPRRQRVLANLRALLAASLQIDGGRYLTPYALVRAFKKGRIKTPNLANAQAVRLLTIHGAKGLEARAVLLLDTDAQAGRANSMGVLVDWPGYASSPQKFVFLASESAPPACAQDSLAQEQAQARREEMNALYVAMTRAKDCLVISSVAPRTAFAGSWWQRLAGLAEPIQVAAQVVDDLADDGAVASSASGPALASADPHPPASFWLPELPLLTQLPQWPQEPVSTRLERVNRSQPQQDSWHEPEPSSPPARIGQAMHRLLEQIHLAVGDAARAGFATLAEVGWSDARLAQLAQEFQLSLAQAQQAADMAQGILQGEAAWAWDSQQIDWQGNEVELVCAGQRLRLDRLVRHRKSGWWVLDYKSAAQPETQAKLIEQMRRYGLAVQAAYPGEAVNLAFLTSAGRMVVIND